MALTTRPDLSIIIVNWNSLEFLRKCLRSIFAQTQNIQFEVIVIDNASYDGSQEMVLREFPHVHFIQGHENVGFARGNNLAFAESSGRNILFLNPDTEIIGCALEVFVRFLDTTPDAGAVGCKLLNSDGSLQTSCILPYPTIFNQAFNTELLRKLFPNSGLWGMRALFENEAIPAEIEAISGACLLTRRDSFLEVGQFTEEYFMYSEDVDLCFKLSQAGLRNFYLGEVSVVHHGGKSTDTKPQSHFSSIVMRESKATFFRLYRGSTYAAGYKLAMVISAVVRLTILGGLLILSLGLYRPISIQNGFRKWSKVLRWALGKEQWVTSLAAHHGSGKSEADIPG